MTREQDDGSLHPPLPVPLANALLDQLSSDDAFRALFVADVRAALRQLGLDAAAIEAALAGVSCLTVQVLASKEDIAAARAALLEHLVGALPHVAAFCLEAGEAGAAKRR